MLVDLIIVALIVTFVSVAALGHILLGVALPTGRGQRRAGDREMPKLPTSVTAMDMADAPGAAQRKLAA